MALAMLLHPLFAGRAFATAYYDQNFDTLNLGDLVGQDNFTKEGSATDSMYQVVDYIAYSGDQSLKIIWTYGAQLSRNLDYAFAADAYFVAQINSGANNLPVGAALPLGFIFNGSGDTEYPMLQLKKNAMRFSGCAAGNIDLNFVDDTLANTWYRLGVEWRQSDHHLRFKIFNHPFTTLGEWSDWYATDGGGSCTQTVDNFYAFHFNYGDSQTYYIDDIQAGTGSVPPEIPPPHYEVATIYPVDNSTTTPNFSNWQVDYKFYDAANATASTSFKLLLFVGAPIAEGTTTAYLYTERQTISGFYPDDDDWHTLFFPRTVNLAVNGEWTLISGLYTLDEQDHFAYSTTTHFTVVGAQPGGILLPPDMSSSTVVLTGCDPNAGFWEYLLCGAFSPSESAMTRFSTLLDYIKNKPPIGYWTKTMEALTTNLASTTPVLQFLDLSALSALTTPLKTIFSWALWIWGLLVIFNRVRKLEL